ncbi:MAG: amino acid permease [Ignavibacteriales bacterium]|nr:amino acid permease [Ignavibacteriales bacterium]
MIPLAASSAQSLTHLQEFATSRPRVLGWIRSAAILDGDWGTSIAYVLGIGFALAGYGSMWHLMLMLGLTSLVALNYITICRLHPNGGGVFSSVYPRSKTMAVIGALLLGADYVITMALSVLDAFHYIGVDHPAGWAVTVILGIGLLNWFGPRHSGSFAFLISIVTLSTLFAIIAFSAPQALAVPSVHRPTGGVYANWSVFVGIILSISGIEAVSNMTGLMKDPARDSRRAIIAVLTKVVLATVFLGLAMHAVPGLTGHAEDMVRFLGEHYVGSWFGWIVAFSLGFLLISAGNTALNDLISVQFLMSVEKELPASLRRINRYGVPFIPLIVGTAAPVIVLLFVNDVLTLAQLYAIGVVGAILINVAATATDRSLPLSKLVRTGMMVSAVVLFLVESSIAVEKPKATLFVAIVLAIGLGSRAIAGWRREPEVLPLPAFGGARPRPRRRTRKAPILKFVLAIKNHSDRLLKFAVDEAKMRDALLIVLRVKEIAVGALPERIQLETNGEERLIDEICRNAGIDYQIVSIPSNEVGYTIAEEAALFGADRVILGAPSRNLLEKALKGNVVRSVGSLLPEEIQLVIYA